MTSIKLSTKVSKNNQTFIPKKVREALEMDHENDLVWIIENNQIKIDKKPSKKDILNKTKGVAKDLYLGKGEQHINKLRDEWK